MSVIDGCERSAWRFLGEKVTSRAGSWDEPWTGLDAETLSVIESRFSGNPSHYTDLSFEKENARRRTLLAATVASM
jgi:hypothetical protein